MRISDFAQRFSGSGVFASPQLIVVPGILSDDVGLQCAEHRDAQFSFSVLALGRSRTGTCEWGRIGCDEVSSYSSGLGLNVKLSWGFVNDAEISGRRL